MHIGLLKRCLVTCVCLAECVEKKLTRSEIGYRGESSQGVISCHVCMHARGVHAWSDPGENLIFGIYLLISCLAWLSLFTHVASDTFQGARAKKTIVFFAMQPISWIHSGGLKNWVPTGFDMSLQGWRQLPAFLLGYR